ncbi:MAG: ATP-binding cassette domain-containing protein [Rhodothermia bacterium]|nr:MAG: ATP-binding cassette domain-containing protein [Rhodothermia bacterium]
MIEVDSLVKRYGPEQAVDDISFQVQTGEVLGFLGPNGAGKTTTMKVITCYLPPSEGAVKVDGLDVRTHALDVKRKIGYLPENTPLYQEMIVYDYLTFVAAMRGVETAKHKSRIAKMADVCGLETVLGKRIEALSKGFRQRVGLAQAMIHDPPILLLDEPTTGLDPNQIVEIRELIKHIGKEKTVILSTHILSEVQMSCDRVLIIHKGKLVADGTPEDLQASFSSGQQVRFGVQMEPDPVLSVLSGWNQIQVKETERKGDAETLFTLTTERKDDLRPELFRLAVDEGWILTELGRDQANLEDVFRHLTTE